MHTARKSQAVGRLGRFVAAGPLVLLLASGCSSLSNTDKGVLGGGALGAGTGAIIGSAVHAPGAGAAIGAGLGAVGGGLIGAGQDASERKQEARLAAAQAAARNPPLSLPEIVQLTQNSSSDAVIINQIRTSGSVYQLSAQDLLYLQNNGVREAVIREMQATAFRAPRYVYAAAPVVQPVYVYDPPPPPIGIGVGFRVR